jgi:serine/threonine protein kinase/tetratricopeptide (TPR) repeat protein
MEGKGNTWQCRRCFTLNSPGSASCSKCGSILEEIRDTLSYRTGESQGPGESIQFHPGRIFDNRYRIIEEIGRGGMGRVYKAEDMELDITVALKIIRPKYAADPHFIERFKKETLTARSISHENVIRLHDIGEAENIKYISMEYIKGQNLGEFLRTSGSLALETAVHIIRQMGEALKAAHQKGIVHLDLKPSNIMIDNSGHIYIMDFGLARSFHLPDGTLSGRVMGTPQYLSPEQAGREKADHRSDIYSLGIIIYEMITGNPPFEAPTLEEYVRMHLHEQPQPPSKINPRIPKPLEDMILKCLEKDKNKRYQRMEEMIQDLEELGPGPSAIRVKKRIARGWYLASAVIIVLAVATGIFIWRKGFLPSVSPQKRISLAIPYFLNNTGDPGLDYMGKSLCELLIADLLQSQHVRVVTGDKLYDILKSLSLLAVSSYSSDDLRKVADLGRTDYVLQGNISRAGDNFRVSASLHRASDLEPMAVEKVEGRGEESIFAMVDSLTKKIKESFNFAPEVIAKDIDKNVTAITTASAEAFKYYVEGKALFQDRRFQDSIQMLEKAVALDPGFALAYFKIAENYYYLRNTEQGDQSMAKAISLLNRVSEREYYLIQAYAAYSPQMAMENYQKLLELYPDDPEANGYLASRYRNMEEWDAALERFTKLTEIDPKDEIAYENIAHIYMAQGLYEKARDILLRRQDLFSSPVSFHFRLGMTYLCDGRFDDALEEAGKALAEEPDDYEANELFGHALMFKDDFEGALKAYDKLISGKDFMAQYMGKLWRNHLRLLLGETSRLKTEIEEEMRSYRTSNFLPGVFNLRLLETYLNLQNCLFPEALNSASQAYEAAMETNFMDYKILALHFRGLALARMGRREEAEEVARTLKREIEEGGRNKLLRHYYHLLGEMDRTEAKYPEAVDKFETAISWLPREHVKTDLHILFLDSLASTFHEMGDLDRAKREYEKIVRLTTGRLRWSDKYSLAFYHLGKIHQERGGEAKAKECYRRFLDIWKNADSPGSEIRDAEGQMARLAGAEKNTSNQPRGVS